jgi:hypothetical protein
MRRFTVSLIVLAAVGLLWGCGDDGDGNGTGNGDTGASRLVVNTTAGAPSVSDPNDNIWTGVDSVTLEVKSTGDFSAKAGESAAIPANVKVQAIEDGGDLYLRLRWGDPSLSAWYGHFSVTDASVPVEFSPQSLAPLETDFLEDQALVMFTQDGTNWDCWNWQVLSAGAAGVAKGINLDGSDSSVVPDAPGVPPVAPVTENPSEFGQPTYLPIDTSNFTGYKFYLTDRVGADDTAYINIDTVIFGNPPDTIIDTTYVTYRLTTGWQLGQRIPRFIIDTSVVNAPPAQRGSLWDIDCADAYNGSGYSLVMKRALTTGFADDIAMAALDSVQVKIVLYDNDFRYFESSTQNRGFTSTFWLIF